jgi:spermidine synthase
VALLGIGLGGLYYAFVGRKEPPTLEGFALTCLLEGLLILLPYALGDRVALLALTLREVGKLGFLGYLFCWGLVTALVVLPAAFVSGVQFPMLMALLGQGRREVGRQIGLTYAWNTAGAIAGSLAGGFGLLPLLGARGCWRLIAVLLAALGGAAIALALRSGRRGSLLVPGAVLLGVLVLQGAEGPTSLWRHSGIGAGRFQGSLASDNDIDRERNGINQSVIWEKDGVESSVGLRASHSLSFVVNGKSDGNALVDSATQVMAGLLGVLLHPEARSALVIGLGTGSTAGWLGAVPAMEQVDVVEIEPAILDVACFCEGVNERVLSNPKVRVHLADAREALQVTPRRYDILFSEPSNPYRAGIASLYTREFYQAASARLAEEGVFLQWIQGYEISSQTIRTVYATLRSVFPDVETWVLDPNDLLLVASRRPRSLDVKRLRALIQQEPFRSALAYAWRVNDLEGILAHHVANDELAAAIAREEGASFNTDDLSPVEFGFARSVGQQQTFSPEVLEALARARGEDRPRIVHGKVDWAAVEDRKITRLYAHEQIPLPLPSHSPDQRLRIAAMRHHAGGDFAAALGAWTRQRREAQGTDELTEMALLGEALAEVGDERSLLLLERLGAYLPLEAQMLRARLRFRQKKHEEAAALLEQAFLLYRTTPWAWRPLAQRSLRLADELAADPRLGLRLLPALSQPFAVRALDSIRLEVALKISLRQPDKSLCVEHLKPFEPFVPWEEDFLKARYACYQEVNHPLTRKSERDLLRFLAQAGLRLDAGLPPPTNPPSPPSPAPPPSSPAPEAPSASASASALPRASALPSASATVPAPRP